MKTDLRAAPTSAVPERRQAVRLDVLDQLDGQIVMFNIPVRLRDISTGGLATEGAIPFTIGSRHLLRLTTPTGAHVVVAAMVAHQRISEADDGRSLFVTGFTFVDDEGAHSADGVRVLLDAIRTKSPRGAH
jgi:hypothetical protein